MLVKTYNSLSGAQVDFDSGLRRQLERPVASVAANPELDMVYPVAYFANADDLKSAARIKLAAGATQVADFSLRPVPSAHLLLRIPLARPPSEAGKESESESDETGGGVGISAVDIRVAEDDFENITPEQTEIHPGLVELSGLPPGEINLTMGMPGDDSTMRGKTIHVVGNGDVDLDMPATVSEVSVHLLIEGKALTTRSDQSASSETETVLEFDSRETGETYTVSAPESTNADWHLKLPVGKYDVRSLEPGLLLSQLEAKGSRVSGHTVQILGSGPVDLTVHMEEENCSLSGFALKNGKAVAGAMIVLVPQDPDQKAHEFRRDQSDSDGSFTLNNVFPGRYTLLAIQNGWELEWAKPEVLFPYFQNGVPVELERNEVLKKDVQVQ